MNKATFDKDIYKTIMTNIKKYRKMKGITSAELSYDHELKSKANDSNYINEHYNELMEEYNRIDNIIKKYI